MNTKWISIRAKSRTQLVMDKYTIGTASGGTPGRGGQKKKVEIAQSREVAARSLWVADDGETVVIPRDTLHRCIVDGGKFHQAGGRRLWTTTDSSLLPGVIEWPPEEAFALEYPVWEVDVRGARVAGGARQDKWRPIFENWAFTFEIGIDVDELHPDVFRDIVDSAGRRIGIGAMRPERKGMCGTFRVDQWTEIDGPTTNDSPLKCESLLKALLKGQKPKRATKEKKVA